MRKFKLSSRTSKRRYSREKRLENIHHEKYTTWVNGRQAYHFFKRNNPAIKTKGKVDSHLYSKIVNTFNRRVAEAIVECQDGVYIEGLGYFGNLVYSDNAMSSKPFYHEEVEINVPLINAHTDGKVYCLGFVHEKGNPVSRTFLPDYCFLSGVRKNFSQALFDGKKYRFNASIFIR